MQQTYDPIGALYERVLILENENKILNEKLSRIESGGAAGSNSVPEFDLSKFDVRIKHLSSKKKNNGIYTVAKNWEYTDEQKNLLFFGCGKYAIISEYMENNIVIYSGMYAPPKSYYAPLELNPDLALSGEEGVYYDNKYVSPIRYDLVNANSNDENSDNKVLSLFGKLRV